MSSDESAANNGSHGPSPDDQLRVVTKVSPWSMADTVARLTAVVAARDMKVLAVIDHSDEAHRVGNRRRSLCPRFAL